MAALQSFYFAPKKLQTPLFDAFSGGMHPPAEVHCRQQSGFRDSDDGFTDDQPLWLYSAHGVDREDVYSFIFAEIFQ